MLQVVYNFCLFHSTRVRGLRYKTPSHRDSTSHKTNNRFNYGRDVVRGSEVDRQYRIVDVTANIWKLAGISPLQQSSKLGGPALVPGVLLNVVHPYDDSATLSFVPEIVSLRLISYLTLSDSCVRQKRDGVKTRQSLASDAIDQPSLATQMGKKRIWVYIPDRYLYAVDPDDVIPCRQ